MANGWWLTDGPSYPRIRGRRLMKMRAELFAKSPHCVLCLKAGRGEVKAVIRDHIIPLAEGGADDATNTQAVCQRCPDTKTRGETERGVRRSQEP